MTTPFDDPSRLPVRDIMCIDCKSFFASTEAIRRGEYPLAAKIAVLSREEFNGGLILAASPDTKRDYGVKLGTRKYDNSVGYNHPCVVMLIQYPFLVEFRISQIVQQFTDEQHCFIYSVDEMFADITHSHALYGSNDEIAARLQDKVFQETGIVTTVGMGPNPLMAKLALDNAAKVQAPWRAYWGYDDVPETLWKIDNLTNFWSIGAKTAAKLEKMGIHSIYDLAHADRQQIKRKFGVLGDALYFHSITLT